jgi:RNA polymerase sigma-70 factor, ECF subfamily
MTPTQSVLLGERDQRLIGERPNACNDGRNGPCAGNSETGLIERVQNGDSEAFYQLIHPHERGVFLAALSILKNEADAEEVAQEAFLKAFRNLPRFRRESKFSTWLIQIAINEAKMKLRKDRRKLYNSLDDAHVTDDGDYIPRDFADWRAIPSEALELSELREALSQALKSLPEKYSSVLILRDVQQWSVAETAEALGISEANVKTRLLRARLQMRDALAPGWSGSWKQASMAAEASKAQVSA